MSVLLFLIIFKNLLKISFAQCSKYTWDKGLCLFCSYDHYNKDLNYDFLKPFPIQDCLPKNGVYKNVGYVSEEALCNEDCDGSLEKPYNSLPTALDKEYTMSVTFLSIELTILIFSRNRKTFFLSSNSKSRSYYFGGENCTIKIAPGLCESYSFIENCIPADGKVTLILKYNMQLLVIGKLFIEGLIIDGADLILPKNDSCLMEKTKCCYINPTSNIFYCKEIELNWREENLIESTFLLAENIQNPFYHSEFHLRDIEIKYFTSHSISSLIKITEGSPIFLTIKNCTFDSIFMKNPIIEYDGGGGNFGFVESLIEIAATKFINCKFLSMGETNLILLTEFSGLFFIMDSDFTRNFLKTDASSLISISHSESAIESILKIYQTKFLDNEAQTLISLLGAKFYLKSTLYINCIIQNNSIIHAFQLAYIKYSVIKIELEGALPAISLISIFFSKLYLVNSTLIKISPFEKSINTPSPIIIFCESNYMISLNEQFKKKNYLAFTAFDEIYIDNLSISNSKQFCLFRNTHSVRHLHILNFLFKDSNCSANIFEEFIFACVEGLFLFGNSNVTSVTFFINFIVIDPAYNLTLVNSIFKSLDFFDVFLINMKSYTDFNEGHVYNYTNITLASLNMRYLDLQMVNTTIKRMLVGVDYSLSGKGSILIISSLTLFDIKFEYYNEYAFVFYCGSGYLLVDNLLMRNISNTTIFYFLVSIPDGKLSIKNLLADFERNTLARFIRLSIENYQSAIIEKFYLILKEFRSNSLMMINNPGKFTMKSALISTTSLEGAHISVRVQNPSFFLIQNCSFFGSPSSEFRISALFYESGPLLKLSNLSDDAFGVLDSKFFYFGESTIVMMRNSYLSIKNIESAFGSAASGSFIRADINSYIDIWNFLFFNLESLQDGGAIFALQSYIFLTNGSFSKINSFKKGGVISVSGSYVVMKDLNIENVMAHNGGFIEAELTSIKVYNCKIKLTFSSNTGGVFFFKDVSFYAFSVDISNAQARDRGGVVFSENSLISFYNCSFFSNKANLGGCFFVNSGIINIINADFYENNATSGTIISSYDGTFLLKNSKISKNNVQSWNLIEMINSVLASAGSVIIGTYFIENNLNDGGIFYLEKSDTEILLTEIQVNRLPIAFMAYTSKSVLVFKNSSFKAPELANNSLAPNEKYLFIGKGSSFYLVSSELFCNSQIGGLYCKDCSNLVFKKVLFDASVSIKGAGVRAEKGFAILFHQTNFTNSYTFDSASLHFENSLMVYFSNCYLSGIRNSKREMPTHIYYTATSNISPSRCTLYLFETAFEKFENLLVLTRLIQAFFNKLRVSGSHENTAQFLSCILCYNFTIHRSEFIGLNKRGVFSFFFLEDTSTSLIDIAFSLFTLCSNEGPGGALSILGSAVLTISNSDFSWITSKLNGGVIYFVEVKKNELSKFYIFNSSFRNCYANVMGGVIYTSLHETPFDQTATFLNNSSPLGPIIVSSPSELRITSTGEEPKVLHHITLRIGQPVSFGISIIDRYGNVLEDLEDCSLRISLENASDINITSNVLTLRKGRGVLNDFLITSHSIYSNLTFDAFITESKFKNLRAKFNVSLKSCEQGEIFFENKCKRCPENFYSFSLDPMSEKIDFCLECPKNAICPGGNDLIPRPGYWRSENNSLIIKCSSSQVCPQNQTHFNFSSQCAEANKGNLCKSCSEDHTNIYGMCKKCFKTYHFWLFLLSSFAIILLFFIFTKRNILYSSDEMIIKDLQIITKILINHVSYLNVLTIIFDFSIAEDIFIGLKSALNYSSSSTELFSTLECVTSGGLNTMSYEFFIFTGFSPFILFHLSQLAEMILIKIFFLCMHFIPCLRRLKNFHQKEQIISFKIDLLIGFGVSVMITYSSLVFKFFDVFRCIELIPGKTYMKMKPDTICWGDDHKKFIISSSVFLLIWGLGFPAYLLFFGLKNKHKYTQSSIKRGSMKFIITFQSIMGDSQVMSSAASNKRKNTSKSKVDIILPIKNFAFRGYKKKYYYWESIVYFRQFFIGVISLLSEYLDSSALSTLFMLAFFAIFFINEMADIYKNPALGKFEAVSFIIVILSVAFAHVTSMKELYLNTRLVFLISIALLNLLFFGIWIKFYYNYMRIKHTLSKKESIKRGSLTASILKTVRRIFK